MKRRNSAFSLKSPNGTTQWVGFDLDMTVIRYKIEALTKHVYQTAVEYLVDRMGYPRSILDIPYSCNSLIRGVILDKALGNLITIDAERRVTNAYHGVTKLSREEIDKIYPEPIDFIGLQTYRWWSCSSHFEIPYIYLAQQLINELDAGRIQLSCNLKENEPTEASTCRGRTEKNRRNSVDAPSSAPTLETLTSGAKTPTTTSASSSMIQGVTADDTLSPLLPLVHSPYFHLMDDLHTTINFNFGNFEESAYFQPFREAKLERVSEFVFDRRSLIPYFAELRQNDVKIFLMTNSNHHYTKCLMDVAFGPDWKSLFDVIIYRSKKPQFFLLDAPFSRLVDPSLSGEIEGLSLMDDDEPLRLGGEYYGGNLKKLQRDLLHSAPVIYVGDELFGDIVAPTCYANWSTIAIVEELQMAEEAENFQLDTPRPGPLLEPTGAQLSVERWGNYFSTSDGAWTYYGALMFHFADIAIPCISRLAYFDPTQSLLPHHPHAQNNATRPISAKTLASVQIKTEHEMDLPANFQVPGLETLTLNAELIQRLKTLRVTPFQQTASSTSNNSSKQ